jgi:hypothetical protein
MTPRQQEKQDLLALVDVLLDEAYALPSTVASWERRQQIDWELIQLFRQIGSLSAGPRPYWSDAIWDEMEAPYHKDKASTDDEAGMAL